MNITYDKKYVDDLMETMLAQAEDTKHTTSASLLRRGAKLLQATEEQLLTALTEIEKLETELNEIKAKQPYQKSTTTKVFSMNL